MEYKIILINHDLNLIKKAALWFSDKWKISEDEYYKSMLDSLNNDIAYPKWYLALNNKEEIIGGIGLIQNDFHKRKDLYPNICALYVTKEYRNKGIARSLINKLISDLKNKGINKVYLVTDHTNLYEKMDFIYYGDIEELDGKLTRMYYKEI